MRELVDSGPDQSPAGARQGGRGGAASPGGPHEPGLVAGDVHKRYGGVRALRGASLAVEPGEIHGLVGENGSGKSTLLKILSGQAVPDRASLSLAGRPLPLGDPAGSLTAGIATVTQETTLVPDLSVAENILLGRRAVRRWYGLDHKATRRRAAAILEGLELEIEPRAVVARLRPDEKQMVELARAISMDARLLILDEPTSSLTDEEVESLFAATRNLRRHGVATIFVSHRLKEVFALTDRVTVLRDGETVATESTADLDSARLIELMVGRRPQASAPAPVLGAAGDGDARLRVRGLTVPGLVDDVSVDIAGGEIVGLAGLVGAGRGDLLKALFGLHPSATGAIELDGREAGARSPAEAMRKGFAYVPEDRRELGLVLEMSIRENLVMASSARARRIGRPPRAREAQQLRGAAERFRIAGASAAAPVGTLSGGNQQKVVLAKWLGTKPAAILLDEPTRGVDVGAKDEIYELLDELRAERLAVLVSSSELPELMRLCDRILVMFRGRLVAALDRAQATEAQIAHYATGHS